MKQKGEDNFVNQNLAYLYNDNEVKGKLHDHPMSFSQEATPAAVAAKVTK